MSLSTADMAFRRELALGHIWMGDEIKANDVKLNLREVFMAEPRAPSSEEFPEVLNFLTANLRQTQEWSLADEYPLALTTANLANVRMIKENGRILSGAVVKNSFVKSPMGLMKIAGIGSVATDPAHRNQGHSRAVLESTLDIAQRSACDIAVLWSNLHDFYRKLGFELAGSEVSLRLDKPFSPPAQDLRFAESNRIAPEAILRIYSQHTCGTMRSLEDVRKSLQIPNMRVYTAWDSNQQLQAYAVEGKGADLNGHIHEWGGAVSKLLPLLNHIVTEQKRPITVIAPRHARNLVRQLQESGAIMHEGVLGMIKIVNPDLLFAKLHRHARNLGIENFVIEQRSGVTHFGFADNVYKTDSASDVVRLIFGPTQASELHSFDLETSQALETLFPIPLWIWGWDSV
ncbi:MAG: GNAT family N-acetyltransferase [Bdellovibrionales bacterium]